MPDHLLHPFITKELKTHLLKGEIRVQTNWQVITGAPCSGKTTLIDQLAARGFRTVPEVGRQFIEEEIAKGRTIQEIRQNHPVFAHKILELSLAVEASLQSNDLLFLDRAVPESLSFYRAIGLDPNLILFKCNQFRYASIFMLDRLPLLHDGCRTEDDATTEFLDIWIERDYRALGHPVVRVPVLSIQSRLEFILERIKTEASS